MIGAANKRGGPSLIRAAPSDPSESPHLTLADASSLLHREYVSPHAAVRSAHPSGRLSGY